MKCVGVVVGNIARQHNKDEHKIASTFIPIRLPPELNISALPHTHLPKASDDVSVHTGGRTHATGHS